MRDVRLPTWLAACVFVLTASTLANTYGFFRRQAPLEERVDRLEHIQKQLDDALRVNRVQRAIITKLTPAEMKRRLKQDFGLDYNE